MGQCFLLVWGTWEVASSEEEEENGLMASFKRDPASTKYLYEETPGKMLLLLDFLAFWLFVTTMLHTFRTALPEPRQKRFLSQLAMFYGGYLGTMPLVVTVAAESFSPWVREKNILTMQMANDFCANAMLCYLLWPTWAEEHFTCEHASRRTTVARGGGGGGGGRRVLRQV